MNLNSIKNTLDCIGNGGLILSIEEAIVLHNSLQLLKNENHFRNIFFWGRICGVANDYYIAYGYVKDVLLGQIYYYSTNCTDWGLLPQPTEVAKLLSQIATTKFHGDPALVIDILCEKDDILVNKMFGDSSTTTKRLKEEDRLAATIFLINEEARIVPRGALFKRPDSVVIENLSFEGLTALETYEQKSYLHFCKPKEKWNTNLLTRKDYNYALDFLDTIDVSIPKESWTIQVFEGRTVIVKSLYWPGMVFYHHIQTPFYGCVYFGNGKKNLDVPFQLPNVQA